MNTIDSTKLIELADADYNMLKERGKEDEKVLHYNGFLDGFARGLYEGSNPWHKASEGLPKDRVFLAHCIGMGQGFVDRILWNNRNGGFDNLNDIPPSASIKESHFADYYDWWMEIPELPKEDRV